MSLFFAKSVMRSVIALFLVLFCQSASAVAVDNLYNSTHFVSSRQEAERLKVTRQGLEEVLIRVSADPSIRSKKPVKDAIERPEHFVQQFDYQVASDGALSLRFEFNHSLVNQTLERAEVPVWAKQRPATLVWLAIDDGVSKRFLSQEATPENEIDLVPELNNRALALGLPLLYPLHDLEDSLSINATDLWEKPANFVKNASIRYESDAILIGKITCNPTNKSWRLDWQLMIGDDTVGLKYEANSPYELVDFGMRWCAKLLKSKGAATAPIRGFWGLAKKPSSEILIHVTEIKDVTAYAALTKYLTDLDTVSAVQVMQMKPQEMIVRLSLKGTVEQLTSAMVLEKHLVRASPPLGNNQVMLHYRWVA